MNEDRRRVLAMLAEGKITADEAERLLAALERAPAPTTGNGAPRYMRVTVDAHDDKDGPTKVNIRIPMQLLRAGVRLTSLVPSLASDKINEAMRRQGVDFDIRQLKPENLDELVEQLSELTVDVDHEDAKVRVFCE